MFPGILPAMEPYLPKLSDATQRWARFLALVAALVLVVWVASQLTSVITPLIAALAIAYVLNPLVSWFERRGARRLFVVTVVFVLVGVLLVGGGVLVLVQLIGQLGLLQQRLPMYAAQLGGWLDWVAGNARGFGPTTAPASSQPTTAPAAGELWAYLGPVLEAHGAKAASAAAEWLVGLGASALSIATLLVLLPMYTFYFLWRFNDMVRAVHDHLPAASRDVIVHVVVTIDAALANFFRGRLLVCMLVGTLNGLGWAIVGVPYSVLLGLATGTLNLVPFGSCVALPLALLASWSGSRDAGVPWAQGFILTMGVFVVVQAIESFALSPYIEGRSSGLHPVAIVVALLIGAQLLGVLGMLLAVPIASTLKVLAGQWILPEIRRLAQRRADPP